MIVEKYSDLRDVTDNMVVDLNNLDWKQKARAISFLAGLTCKKGKLVKIAKDKFLIIIEA